MDRFEEAGKEFAELIRIMARLRAPDGCPWDLKQTFATIKPYLLEESYEVMDAIDSEDWPGLAEELGDLLLQPAFLAQIAHDRGLFDVRDALQAINRKLVRRHPHIFGNGSAKTAEDVKLRWDEIKLQEKAERGPAAAESRLSAIPRTLPALVEAEKISRKAADAGFEWPDVSGVVEKIQEEAAELAEARASGDMAAVEHEVGDLLFTVVNLARFLKIDPEQALRKTSARFRKRFAHIEREVASRGARLEDASLDQMEELWRQAKHMEKS